MTRILTAALIALAAAPAFAQEAPDFWLHPYNFFGDEDALTASVNLGDLDGDGDLDGFAVNGRHWIEADEVYLNNGMGFFRSARGVAADRSTGYETALADFDGDGDLDAAIARDLLPVLLLTNDGTGRFGDARELGEVAQARSIAAGDLDGDGDTDLVLVERGSANRYFLNDGTGGFGGAVELPGEYQTIQVAIADLNGDGRMDLVFSNRGGEGLPVYRGTADGFEGPEMLASELALEMRAVEVGDVTGDGHPDILAGGIGDRSVLLVNDGEGGFAEVRRFGAATDQVYGLALGDFDRDGAIDIAVANSEVPNVVYMNRGGDFEPVPIPPNPFDPEAPAPDSYNVAVGDLDGDGWDDIVYAVSGGSNFTVINRTGRD